MGCDIHLTFEKRYGAKWVGVFSTTHHIRPKIEAFVEGAQPSAIVPVKWLYCGFGNRDYEFFAKLAGVRGDGPEAKGMPSNASDLAKLAAECYDGDGHSHSWNSLEEFLTLWVEARENRISEQVKSRLAGKDREKALLELVGIDDESTLDDFRVVYFFDN